MRPRQISPNRTRYGRWVALGLLCVVLAASLPPARRAILVSAGQALVTASPVADADVVVLPTEVGPAGELEVADVFAARHVARALIMSAPLPSVLASAYGQRQVTPIDQASLTEQVLVRLGIPQERIEILRVLQGGTNGEAGALIEWCEAQGVRRVIVVSSGHHSRRLARVLRRAIAGRSLTVAVRPAQYDSFHPDDWWQQRDTLRVGLIELQKLMLDVVLHPWS